MGLSQTILFYLVIGAAVAVAVLLRGDRRSRGRDLFQMLLAWFFWPMYLPVLLSSVNVDVDRTSGTSKSSRPMDDIATAIAQVEAELESAVSSLDGWAENVLSYEETRFGELRAAWRAQAERIRELDRLLAQPEFVHRDEGAQPSAANDPATSRMSQSEQARRENIERLHHVRRRLHDDLMGTLAWVRELVTMIHLAKFTGAPASRAEELVTQIAAAVEGLSEVSSWREEAAVGVL